MSTGARGEAFVDAENQSHPVLFTNRAIAEAERSLGKGVVAIVSEVDSISLGALARLTAIGLEYARRDRKDGGKSITVDDAFAVLDEYGMTAVAAAVYGALSDVMSYSKGGDNPPA